MDIVTSINGVAVTLTDNGDGTYNIDLTTSQGRGFIRAELQQLREDKDVLVRDRDLAELRRARHVAARDSEVVAKSAAAASIDEVNIRIAELVAFLQGQGDDT